MSGYSTSTNIMNTYNPYGLGMSMGFSNPYSQYSMPGSNTFMAPNFFNTGINGFNYGVNTTGTSTSTNSSSSKKNSNLSTIFKGITKKEEKVLEKYISSKKEYVEDLGTSLLIGTGMGLVLPNMRNVAHPFSAVNTAFNKNSVTNTIFKDIVKSDAWKKDPDIYQTLYAQLQKAEVRANKWSFQGIFKRGYTQDEFNSLKDIASEALNSGKRKKVLEAAAKLKEANSIKEGWIPKGINWAKGKVSGWLGRTPDALPTVANKISNTQNAKAIKSATKSLISSTDTSFKACFKNSMGGKIGIVFGALGILSEWEYLKAAWQEEDSSVFWKQLGQSVAKAGSSWFGYNLGAAIGKWGGAKLGAMIGSAVCPGLGTLIGGAAGLLCGTVASCGLRKLTNWAVGDNVANDLIAKNEMKEAKKSDQKKAELLQTVIAQAESDKNIDENTAKVISKLKQAYG